MTCLRIFVYNSSTQKQPLALATVCGQYALYNLKLNIIRLLYAGDCYTQWHRLTFIHKQKEPDPKGYILSTFNIVKFNQVKLINKDIN